jgi:hypothetical protein
VDRPLNTPDDAVAHGTAVPSKYLAADPNGPDPEVDE